MTKAEIRSLYKEKRKNLSLIQIEEKSMAIANRALKLPIWDKTYYHVFLSIKSQKEVDTDLLLHILQGKDKQVVVCKSDFKSFSLKHFLLTDATPIKTNAFGIPEPQEGIEVPLDKIDVIFVPLLAFDRSGHRLGYGKGFYDRFLSQCRSDSIKIGLSFFKPLKQHFKADQHDVPLDYVVTSDEVYIF